MKFAEEYVIYIEKRVLVFKKIFTNGLNMVLQLWARVKREFTEWEHHFLSSKEKIMCASVNKGGDADSVLRHEKTYCYWFPWKGATVNSASHYQLFRQNWPHLLNDPCIKLC